MSALSNQQSPFIQKQQASASKTIESDQLSKKVVPFLNPSYSDFTSGGAPSRNDNQNFMQSNSQGVHQQKPSPF